jgi:hypothetical protein
MRLSAEWGWPYKRSRRCWPRHHRETYFRRSRSDWGYSARGADAGGWNAGGGAGAVECLPSGHPWRWIMLAALGAAGTDRAGAWSIDARLFGWKRFEIRDRSVRTRLLMSQFSHPYGYSLARRSPSRLNRGHQSSEMAGTPLELGLRAGGNWIHDAHHDKSVNNLEARRRGNEWNTLKRG